MRIAILGAGRMGTAHALAYAEMRDVRIAGICGGGGARAERLADDLDVPFCDDPYVLLDDSAVDAVDVTVPTERHREYVVAALERGKHVLCEVPLAWTLEDVEAMLAAAQQADAVLGAALLTRFVVEFVEARDLVRSGSLGAPRSVAVSRLAPPYATSPDVHYGDVLLELAPLDYDLLHWMLGPSREVAASGVRAPDGWVDHVFATLSFDGAVAHAEAAADLPRGFAYRTRLRVVCEDGAVEATTRMRPDGPPDVSLLRWEGAGAPAAYEIASRSPYAAECAYFVDCARGEEDPGFISAHHALEALRVATAARESLRRGVPVEIVR